MISLDKYQPILYIDAQRISDEISRAPLHGNDIAMNRNLGEIEKELEQAERNCQLTLDAIALLQQLVTYRRISYGFAKDNLSIAAELAKSADCIGGRK